MHTFPERYQRERSIGTHNISIQLNSEKNPVRVGLKCKLIMQFFHWKFDKKLNICVLGLNFIYSDTE